MDCLDTDCGRTGVARQEVAVKAFSIFTFCTWLACVLTHVCICMPASRSWQVKAYAGGRNERNTRRGSNIY